MMEVHSIGILKDVFEVRFSVLEKCSRWLHLGSAMYLNDKKPSSSVIARKVRFGHCRIFFLRIGPAECVSFFFGN